jgi:ribosomal protein L37AE/L43A
MLGDMNGNTIQELPCPSCRNRRTVRVGRSSLSFCFNCRSQWAGGSITAAQRERFERYRGAVRAGLYRDW